MLKPFAAWLTLFHISWCHLRLDFFNHICWKLSPAWENYLLLDFYLIYICEAISYFVHSVQEWGKQHGIISKNVVSSKFHNKSWTLFDWQMTCSFSSAIWQVIWQPRAAQDLLWNTIFNTSLEMILCHLPQSCTEHRICLQMFERSI